MKISAAIILILTASVFILQAWRWWDNRRATLLWRNLIRTTVEQPAVFDPAMLKGLPQPARRYFLFTIAPGAPLSSAVEIEMDGEIRLGTRQHPNPMSMRARQLLAAPNGLVWKLHARKGVIRISGSDGIGCGQSWTRFWLLGTIPVVRAGGDPDHMRSAFGRVVAESVFFAPAALLPRDGVTWVGVCDNVARATLVHNGISQSLDLTVGEDGHPTKVVISRWSNANPDKIYRLQPFGGYLSDFRDFEGYTLPTRIEGGNFIGTEAYFPFYLARIKNVTWQRL
jgi:hypothetical protein